ncbi:MAG TPA: UDP-2,3-diacylglucosamine diphosphatase [Pseudobdellovibrionaceae bacterium]|nr:UDP-2,3-diacylglucosamine diphosphatase [Pseudobdellovibrionaceae bacterium]
MDAVFLSDLHLKSLEERNGKILLRFLTSLEERPGKPPTIFLLGDIFDLWISGHQVFLRRYETLLASLKRLADRGAQIVYFEGNHDMHLAIYWEKHLGADVRTRPGLFQVGGLRIRCEHGDEINRDDTSYLKLRAFLRHPIMEKMAHVLPGRFLDALGNRWSKHSRKRSSVERAERESRIREMLRRHAETVWEEDPFDAIVSGHMHVKDDWSFEKNRRSVRAINLGSWFETREILILENGRLHWRNLDPE